MQARWEYLGDMKPLAALALVAILLTACKRNESAAGSPGNSANQAAAGTAQQPADGPPTSAPTVVPKDAVAVSDNADVNATLSELSQQFRVYVSSTRSRPKDFQDFVTRSHVQPPPPPSGQAYAISGGKIVLVKK